MSKVSRGFPERGGSGRVQPTKTAAFPPHPVDASSTQKAGKVAFQSLDQRIAQAAHQALLGTGEKDDKDLRNAIKKAATRLRTSGIGVTMAFALGKGEQHAKAAKAWCQCLKQLGFPDCADPEATIGVYRTAGFARICRLTEASERILEWLAKWADAYKQDDARDVP